MTIDIGKARMEYVSYIREHRENVHWAWRTIQCVLDNYDVGNIGYRILGRSKARIEDLIWKHDLSKFDEEEFEPYRSRFFPIDGEESDKEAFDKAWQHHKDHNLHHWQSMEAIGYEHEHIFEYTVEMICDWFAMARKFGENHRAYYEKNKDNIILEPWQNKIIESIYSAMDKYLDEKGGFENEKNG